MHTRLVTRGALKALLHWFSREERGIKLLREQLSFPVEDTDRVPDGYDVLATLLEMLVYGPGNRVGEAHVQHYYLRQFVLLQNGNEGVGLHELQHANLL